MAHGFGGVSFRPIADSLKNSDPYMVLADFDDYVRARRLSDRLYRDSDRWYRMGLVNTARAGRFSADRAIREYADEIWNAEPVPQPEQKRKKKAEAKADDQ
jgi:starch phosphorylase